MLEDDRTYKRAPEPDRLKLEDADSDEIRIAPDGGVRWPFIVKPAPA
jgi:hypothetical protein